MNFRDVFKIVLGEADLADFTDSTSTTGYYDFTVKKPAGFLPIAGKVETITEWSAAATAELGTSADPDAYIDGAVITAAGAINATPGADTDLGIGADQTVRVTITHATDFTAYTTGKVRAVLYCLDLNEEDISYPS